MDAQILNVNRWIRFIYEPMKSTMRSSELLRSFLMLVSVNVSLAWPRQPLIDVPIIQTIFSRGGTCRLEITRRKGSGGRDYVNVV